MAAQWVTGVLEGMLAAQLALRDGLHALGLTPLVAGQPQWPFAHRLAAEMMWIDPGHARRVAITGLCILFAAFLLLATLLRVGWKARLGLVSSATAALIFAPWPASHLLWAEATPTSLHRNASDFSPASILRGLALFQQHCQQCHGADARGEGPQANKLAMWPPNLAGGLLWKRLEGELFWHVRHGMRSARTGRETMPGTADIAMTDADIWKVLDYLQANAAGQTLRSVGVWERPVRLPRFQMRCRNGGERSSASFLGQRLLIALPSDDRAAQAVEDPRWVSVVLGSAADAECVPHDEQLLSALALLLGDTEQGARGQQLLVDRDGWLRARSKPGLSAWSVDDLICRTESGGAKPSANANEQGIDALLRRMDDDPVRLVRAGFPH